MWNNGNSSSIGIYEDKAMHKRPYGTINVLYALGKCKNESKLHNIMFGNGIYFCH